MLFVSILAFLSAISISSVAAYYSIIGLTTIFPASFLAIIIMGSVLEIGKITAAIWLHTFWNDASYLIKSYLSTAVIILMFITSLGIFGFLSKAHIDHNSESFDSRVQIEQIDLQISREERIIEDTNKVLFQLDEAIRILMEAQRIRGPEGAIAVREQQKEERAHLNKIIDDSNEKILELNREKVEYSREQERLEAEVGPLRFVAELIYGPSPDKSLLEEAVRWLIILLVIVFDPLAITLIIAAISGINIRNNTKTAKKDKQNQYVTNDILIKEQNVNSSALNVVKTLKTEQNVNNQLINDEIDPQDNKGWLGG